MKKSIFLLLTILFVFSACKNKSEDLENSEEMFAENQYEKLQELNWVLGEWINKEEDEYSKETWIQDNDSTFSAFSYTQVGLDTVFAENLVLEQKGENLFLTAIAYNQNDDLPVTFKKIPSEKGLFAFENKNHDFPERIIYTNPVKDSIHAWIEGTVNGEPRKVDFYFERN